MFNFDKDIVINGTQADLDKKIKVENGVIVIRREGNYKEDNIQAYKMDGTPLAAKTIAKITAVPFTCGSIDLSGCIGAPGDIVRVSFKIACSGKYGEFAMANWHAFEKAIMVEFEGGDVKNLVAALKLAIDAEVATVSDAALVELAEPIFSIVEDSVKAVKVTENCSACGDYAVEVETDLGVTPTIVKAVEGTGNYYQLIQNVRYPSRENLRFASPNAEEMPIAGVCYDEYSFDYIVDRENPAGGLSAVGQKITSKVHVNIFVPTGLTLTGVTVAAAE